MAKNYDFSGWATRNNLKCGDGRVILKDAFKECDGTTVPLVWNHQHNEPFNVLGHALLENRDSGVYAYCTFNDTESGLAGKKLVQHGDVTALSIYANKLKQNGPNVEHGVIREVSLVLAGANPGAFIDSILEHSDNPEEDDEAIIHFVTGDDITMPKDNAMEHSDENTEKLVAGLTQAQLDEIAEYIAHAEEEKSEKTVEDVFNELNEEQKNVVYYMIGAALEEAKKGEAAKHNDTDEGEENTMKHNVFDGATENKKTTLSHDDMQAIMADAKRLGSLKEAFLAHGESDADYTPATGPNGTAGTNYGIANINYLFPDDRMIGDGAPEFIKRDTEWVSDFMGRVHHTPFSRVKSKFANLTADAARARGYVKGKKKVEEVITLLKRATGPQTIYKKQRLDRDDILDITDFNVVAWLKGEMRIMLDEEIARACLVGDGRLAASDDKIQEIHVRPIWTDDSLYTIKYAINAATANTEEKLTKEFIKGAVKARKDYKGSGNPVLYTTEDMLTNCLLLEDQIGHRLYKTEGELATALRVSKIVTVPVMENLTRTTDAGTHTLLGIIVNPKDYNIGADKGGSVSMFEDFDIDFNQEKYLIETRISGAMVVPYAAIAIESVAAAAAGGNDDEGGEG